MKSKMKEKLAGQAKSLSPTEIHELQNRRRIYLLAKTKLLEDFNRDPDVTYGLCSAVSKAALSISLAYGARAAYYNGMKKNFPEIWKRRPKTPYKADRRFWWSHRESGLKLRMRVLDGAIREIDLTLAK